MPEAFRNFVNGAWVDADEGATFEKTNPSRTQERIGFFPRSGPADIDAAVRAARQAFPA